MSHHILLAHGRAVQALRAEALDVKRLCTYLQCKDTCQREPTESGGGKTCLFFRAQRRQMGMERNLVERICAAGALSGGWSEFIGSSYAPHRSGRYEADCPAN